MLVLKFFNSALARLGQPRKDPAIPIRLVLEERVLTSVTSADELFHWQGRSDGVIFPLSSPDHIGEDDLTARLVGRIGGGPLPYWASGKDGAPRFGVNLFRVSDALYAPEFGAVVTKAGAVLKSSVGEALFLTADLSGLPGVTLAEHGLELRVVRPIPHKKAATVFVAWGGRFNYGHFLLDCLPALCAADVDGRLDHFKPLAPRLQDWHRTLIRLTLGQRARLVVELDTPWVSVSDVIFASPMDHFLHAPADPLKNVRANILRNLPDHNCNGPERIYLSRSQDEKRPMVNEAILEAALVERGFAIVHLSAMPVEDQIILLRGVKIVVGPTGAGFANCLFSPFDAKIFEIQPTNYSGIWVRGLCHYLGLDWFGYFAPSPLNSCDNVESIQFRWETPLDDFLAFLDARI